MKKLFQIFLLIAITISLNKNLNSMEQQSTSESPEFLWTTLPIELQQIILSHVGLDKANSFSLVLERLGSLKESPLFSNIVNNKSFITGLAKIYIEKHKEKAIDEFYDAVKGNEVSVVKAFIEAGIDVNAKSSLGAGRTPLMLAASNGNKEIVQMLLDAKADVNDAEDENNDTALLLAALEGKEEVVRLLLDAGANTNASNIWGITALMDAAQHNDKEIVKMLIANGADVNAKDRERETALSLARSPEIVEILKAAGARE